MRRWESTVNPSLTNPVFGTVYAEASARPWSDADRGSRGEGIRFKQPQLVWADKVGLAAVIVIAGLSALACATVLLAAGTLSFGRLNHVLAVWSGVAELAVGLPIWLLMRGIDFAANGPAHRRAARKSHTA